MRIREGDPLEIYTTKEGEVIFKKYSLLGGLEDFAAQFCDTLSRNTDFTAAITDRDSIIAVAGAPKRELLGKTVSERLEKLMEQRQVWSWQEGSAPVQACVGVEGYFAAVAAPIICAGDVLGLVLFLGEEGVGAGEAEHKLAQTVASFLGKNMEN